MKISSDKKAVQLTNGTVILLDNISYIDPTQGTSMSYVNMVDGRQIAVNRSIGNELSLVLMNRGRKGVQND